MEANAATSPQIGDKSKVRPLRGAAKRSSVRARDLELRVWKLMEEGKKPTAIASQIGIARQSVHRIAKRVDEAYRRDTFAIVDRIKTEQALRLELIADEAMAAWRRSIEADTEKISIKRSAGQERHGEVSKTTTRTPGNPEYLRVAMEALQEIRLLFGVGTDGKEHGAQSNGINMGIGVVGLDGQPTGQIRIATRWSTPAELGMIQPPPAAVEVPVERIEDRGAHERSEPSGPHNKWAPKEPSAATGCAPFDKARGI